MKLSPLFIATASVGAFLLLKGLVMLASPALMKKVAFHSLRSRAAAIAIFGSGLAWFLWNIWNLGTADFGEYKIILFAIFGTVGILSFFYVDDFLPVRGASVLTLLLADVILQTAYMQEPQSRLFLVSFVYFCILLALYFGSLPYRLRDLLSWIYKNNTRPRIFGGIHMLYGIILVSIAFMY